MQKYDIGNNLPVQDEIDNDGGANLKQMSKMILPLTWTKLL